STSDCSTLSLHDALPISIRAFKNKAAAPLDRLSFYPGVFFIGYGLLLTFAGHPIYPHYLIIAYPFVYLSLARLLKGRRLLMTVRSEEHTSELQSPYDLVC